MLLLSLNETKKKERDVYVVIYLSQLDILLERAPCKHGSVIFKNKKTPEGVYAGCVGVSKNYRYVEWQ